jgi:Tc5 transposase DNA-binding domain
MSPRDERGISASRGISYLLKEEMADGRIDVIPPQRPPRLNARFCSFFSTTFNAMNSTTNSRIESALADLESQDSVNYAATARKWQIERTTLARRHKGQSTSRAAANSKYRQRLTNVQEETLLKHIESLTERYMPPTSQIVQNLAEEIAGSPVGKNWTSQFIKRHQKQITSVYLRSIDKSRVSAKSTSIFEEFYILILYFTVIF